MKEKFLRIISPLTLTVVLALDAAVLGYGIYAIKRIIDHPRAAVIIFAACDFVALIVAVLVTKETVSNGIKFFDDELEFTGIDEGNVFAYDDIVSVETERDTKASFVKNFNDRKSKIILKLKNEQIVTVDIGLTSQAALDNAAQEINKRIQQSN